MIDGNFSFIDSVFPNYKPSEINSLAQIKSVIPNKLPVPTQTNFEEIYKKFVNEKQSNSYFFNTPLSLDKITSPLLGKPITNLSEPVIEKMTNVNTTQKPGELTHEQYVEHVLNCPECKQMIMNALNLESSKKQNNNIIEFLAFVLIGLFLIYLLNR